MSPEEARTLVAENEALHAQGLGLRPQVAKVAGQLQTAEERIGVRVSRLVSNLRLTLRVPLRLA